uniref:Uncharacterized protein n=1 Tax=Brassica oleracea TaxID=3712 RepID=A0A3P6GMU3_BRAOL|nr:unnamed protein product [Brassica oleracea]
MTFESQSDQDGARSVTRAEYEETKQAFGATSRSEVANPLRTQPLVNNFRESERPGWSEVRNPRTIRRDEAESRSDVPERGGEPALEAERPMERPYEPVRASLLLIKNLCFIWAF